MNKNTNKRTNAGAINAIPVQFSFVILFLDDLTKTPPNYLQHTF